MLALVHLYTLLDLYVVPPCGVSCVGMNISFTCNLLVPPTIQEFHAVYVVIFESAVDWAAAALASALITAESDISTHENTGLLSVPVLEYRQA